MGRLHDKVAIITGGGRGMGAGEAALFAREGASVAVCDVLQAEGREVVETITRAGGSARFFLLDVKQDAQWREVVSEVLAWKSRLNILVNNAGIINRLGILDTSLDNWHRVLDVNLTGPFLGMKYCAPAMRDSGGGSIINVASIAAYMGLQCAAYVSSKTGLVGLTRTAAIEFTPWNIRANAICPGTIVTGLNAGAPHLEPMREATPMKRYGTPEEIANLALFLASDEASYITGVDLPIDGGVIAGGALHGIALQPSKDALAIRNAQRPHQGRPT